MEIGPESHTLTHGQYVFLDENIPHALQIDDAKGCSILNIEFSCRQGGGCACARRARAASPTVEDFFRSGPSWFVASGSRSCGPVLSDLISQLEAPPGADTRFLIGILLERLLCEFASAYARRGKAGSLRYVRRAVAFLEERYTEPLTVAGIAAAAGVNRSYLQALFRKEFGCGVLTYVNRLRISRAKFLLTGTGMALADIAAQVGFNSRQNFALAFARESGLSPSAFRRRNAKGVPVDTRSMKQLALKPPLPAPGCGIPEG